MAKKDDKPTAAEPVEEASVLPAEPAVEAPEQPKEEAKPKNGKKVKSDNGYLGDSPQGAAMYEKGKHPKDRQLAERRANE